MNVIPYFPTLGSRMKICYMVLVCLQIPIGPDNDGTETEDDASSESDDEVPAEGVRIPHDELSIEPEDECPIIHSVVHDDHVFEEEEIEHEQTCPARPRVSRRLQYSDDE